MVNLTDAIAIGGDLPTLVRRLKAAEERQQDLCARMQQVTAGAPRLRIDWRTTERLARHTLQDLRGLLTRQVSEGRELLRRLLRAPIRFTPFADAGRRGYRFDGQAVLDQMFGGVIEVIGMASPRGNPAVGDARPQIGGVLRAA